MAVESITHEQFMAALKAFTQKNVEHFTDANGELCYTIAFDSKTGALIRSSIRTAKNLSAGAGDDSIRVYPIRLPSRQVLGPKICRWVQRTSGWRKHIQENVELFELWRARAGDCPQCSKEKEFEKVTKKGSNEGRYFAVCWDHFKESYTWLDEDKGIVKTFDNPFVPSVSTVSAISVPVVSLKSIQEAIKDCPTLKDAKANPPKFVPPPKRAAVDPELLELGWDASLEPDVVFEEQIPIYDEEPQKPLIGLTFEHPPVQHFAPKTDSKFSAPPVIPPSFRLIESDITPSTMQRDFYYMLHQGDTPVVLIAVAGSGKTKTEIDGLQYFDRRLTVGMAAFGKDIAATAKKSAPRNVTVGTFHSLALSAVMRKMPETRLVVGKYGEEDGEDKMNIVYNMVTHGQNKFQKSMVLRLAALCKNMLMEPTEDNLNWLTDRYSMDIPAAAQDLIYSLVEKVYVQSVELNHQMVDFNDIIWLIATDKVSVRPFDRFLIDETQDLDPAQIEMAFRMGKIVYAVGDPNQSIYGFRGADTDAMPKLIDRLKAKVLPLSICYRCPKSSIRLAQRYVPEIMWREGAPEGIVDDILEKDFHPQPGDLNISRVNSALVKPCLALIRSGVNASIRGRDMGRGIANLLNRGRTMAGTDSLPIILTTLANATEMEVSKLVAAKKVTRAEFLQDQFDCLVAIAEQSPTFDEANTKIGQTFSDKTTPVQFQTIHGAKGLQAKYVSILKPELVPMVRKNQQEWEIVQEDNLAYVAYTRNQQVLHFVRE